MIIGIYQGFQRSSIADHHGVEIIFRQARPGHSRVMVRTLEDEMDEMDERSLKNLQWW